MYPTLSSSRGLVPLAFCDTANVCSTPWAEVMVTVPVLSAPVVFGVAFRERVAAPAWPFVGVSVSQSGFAVTLQGSKAWKVSSALSPLSVTSPALLKLIVLVETEVKAVASCDTVISMDLCPDANVSMPVRGALVSLASMLRVMSASPASPSVSDGFIHEASWAGVRVQA